MQALEYPDRSPDFDDQVDPNKTDQQQIKQYLDENYGDTLPDDFKEGLARDIEKMREDTGGPTGPEGEGPGDIYYDPDSNAWRDSETGQFTSGPQ